MVSLARGHHLSPLSVTSTYTRTIDFFQWSFEPEEEEEEKEGPEEEEVPVAVKDPGTKPKEKKPPTVSTIAKMTRQQLSQQAPSSLVGGLPHHPRRMAPLQGAPPAAFMPGQDQQMEEARSVRGVATVQARSVRDAAASRASSHRSSKASSRRSDPSRRASALYEAQLAAIKEKKRLMALREIECQIEEDRAADERCRILEERTRADLQEREYIAKHLAQQRRLRYARQTGRGPACILLPGEERARGSRTCGRQPV